jgi:hypothetical protein
MFTFLNMAIFIFEIPWKVSRVSVEVCAIPSLRHTATSLSLKRKEASIPERLSVIY